jgi:menaquinone-9 beta-reductase
MEMGISLFNSNQREAMKTYDLAIVGGGLAGLSLAILSAKTGLKVIVLEKGDYPKHKVCGEYISMESYNFVKSLGLTLDDMSLPKIDTFVLTSHHNLTAQCRLETGGFGISRFKLDDLLAKKAIELGVELQTNHSVSTINYDAETHVFSVKTKANLEVLAKLAIGTFGRVSGLSQRKIDEDYIGVKYHIDDGPAANTIEIHNFEGGYCGISQIEDGKYCICYLAKADKLKILKGDIDAFEKEVLFKNPYLKLRLQRQKLIKAVTTSQIRFGVNNNDEFIYPVLGDAAGFIPPITGNGMSLAFRAAATFHKEVQLFFSQDAKFNLDYLKKQNNVYNKKYLNGRIQQGVFLQKILFLRSPIINKIVMFTLTKIPFVMRLMTKKATGTEIK